ncbi:MAG TPA: hypothetical protein VGF86_03975 [Candidatus Tumulicola sp.]
MKPFLAATLIASAMLAAGCGDRMTPQAGGGTAVSAVRSRGSSSSSLLYVSNAGDDTVSVYDYQDGNAKFAFRLTGFAGPAAECVAADGSVFVINVQNSKIYEYAHGGTGRVATVTDRFGSPQGCAVDPASGNLAVTNASGLDGSPGNVVVYPHGLGKPKQYFISDIDSAAYCVYADDGSLYVDGFSRFYFSGRLDILSPGSKSFKTVTINGARILGPGAMQWDQSDLLVGDSALRETGHSGIYRFKITGLEAKAIDTTKLRGSGSIYQFWEGDGKIWAPQSGGNAIHIYAYPAGALLGRFAKSTDAPYGITVSSAP